MRNTKIVDIIKELSDYGIEVKVHDPIADLEEAKQLYRIPLMEYEDIAPVDAVILSVKHDLYCELGLEKVARLCVDTPIIVDIKGVFSLDEVQKIKDINYWRL